MDSVQQLKGYRAAIVLSYKLHDSCTMTLWKLQGVGKLTVRLSCNYVHSCTIIVLLIEIAPKQKAVKENDTERPQVLSQKSPRDSRISSCIRVSKCPRVTRLKNHSYTYNDRSLPPCLAYCCSKAAIATMSVCSHPVMS